MLDPDGGVYFTYFGDPLLGRLDPKTGAVRSFPVPILKENAAKGTLSLARDHDGNYWISLMYQAGAAKFDKATKSFTMLAVSAEFNRDCSQQAFVAPQSSHVDGKLWIQDVASTSVYRVDLKTGKFENLTPFADIKPEFAARRAAALDLRDLPRRAEQPLHRGLQRSRHRPHRREDGRILVRADPHRPLAAAPRRVRQ